MGVRSFVTVFAASVLVPSLIWAATPPAAGDAACAVSCTVGVISEISDTSAASTTFFGPTLWPYSYVSPTARKDNQISNQTGYYTGKSDLNAASVDSSDLADKNTGNTDDFVFIFYVNGQVEIIVSNLDMFDLLIKTAEPDTIEQVPVNKTLDGTIVWNGNHPNGTIVWNGNRQIKPVVKNRALNIKQIPGKKTIKITFALNTLARVQNPNNLKGQAPQTITICWNS